MQFSWYLSRWDFWQFLQSKSPVELPKQQDVPLKDVPIKVKLTFDSFSLEPCFKTSSGCGCVDHVEIRDGKDANSDRLGTFCGDTTPPPILSTGRFMFVEFDADFSDNEEGFRASYAALGKNLLFCFRFISGRALDSTEFATGRLCPEVRNLTHK